MEKKELLFNQKSFERLDKFLSSNFSDHSRSQIQRLISEGYVWINGEKPQKNGVKLDKGDLVEIHFPEPEPLEIVAEDIPLEILYEDRNVIAINKPAGMVVHPSAGHKTSTLVHALISRVKFIEGIGGKMRPGIVHRLDKNTSGVILVAKNEESHIWLQRQFILKQVEKIYHALVDGHPHTLTGRIIAPIYRHPVHRKKMAVAPAESGKPSETEYFLMELYKKHAFLKVHPITGRTHQIRVHLASIGIPISGDTVYGYKTPSIRIDRHFLHASQLTIRLPGQKEMHTFKAELPPELVNILNTLIK